VKTPAIVFFARRMLFRRGRPEKKVIPLRPIEIEAGRGVQMAACAETFALYASCRIAPSKSFRDVTLTASLSL
jgi:hypothetical protein